MSLLLLLFCRSSAEIVSHRVTAGDIDENAKHDTGKKAAKTYTRIAFIVIRDK